MRGLLGFRPDGFTMALVGTVILATFLPCHGASARVFNVLAVIAIAALFFLQGARLSRQAVISGATAWRLHLLIMASTFVLFPIIGLVLRALVPGVLTPPLWLGVLFVCALPSTVQSSIAFTSIGMGNVPAAICAATASNLLGILITPVLVGLLLSLHGSGISLTEIWKIVLQLLVPFAAGQLLRPLIGEWAQRNRRILAMTDRSSILLVVYTAFSEAVVQGIWHQLPPTRFAVLIIINAVILGLVLLATTHGSRALGFSRRDEVAIVFCGSKKTLASGVPMANVLFAGPTVGMTVLPLMIFHQMQLMVCAWLARRYAARAEAARQSALSAVPSESPAPG
ncbi:MAG: bile acid:sodium symporter [Acidisphaera sp.]|nr:bile acid:sodium symporter [Acidisphaera sp.]